MVDTITYIIPDEEDHCNSSYDNIRNHFCHCLVLCVIDYEILNHGAVFACKKGILGEKISPGIFGIEG